MQVIKDTLHIYGTNLVHTLLAVTMEMDAVLCR